MSSLKDRSSSMKNRLMPYVPAIAIGVIIGAVIVIKLHPSMKWTGDVLLSDRMLKQIKEHGSGMFKIEETGQFVDLIDWSHPSTISK